MDGRIQTSFFWSYNSGETWGEPQEHPLGEFFEPWPMRTFNDYVDRKWGIGGPKKATGGGQKNAKLHSHSHWMTPFMIPNISPYAVTAKIECSVHI